MLLSMLFCCCVTLSSAYVSRFSALFPTLSDDVAAQVGHSAVIPFSWSGTDKFLICHYLRNDTVKQFIYIDGKSMIGDGFTVHRNNTGSYYELIISTVRHDHAGIYDLIVDGSVVSKRFLTVISGPSCNADRNTNRHEAYYQCSVQHTGPAQPVMEWPVLGECSETDTSTTYNTAGLSIRKSSCTVAVPHANKYILRHSKACTLSFIDAHRQKLRQIYTCSAVMPQAATSSDHWLDTYDRMYIRLGHIMYLILLGLSVFIIYCLRNLFMWTLNRLHKWCNYLLSHCSNSNTKKQYSNELNTALPVIDS